MVVGDITKISQTYKNVNFYIISIEINVYPLGRDINIHDA